MSAKRSKMIRRIALAAAPFHRDVDYEPETTHLKFVDLNNQPVNIPDPRKLTDTCYRKAVKKAKIAFAYIRSTSPLATNDHIAYAITPVR